MKTFMEKWESLDESDRIKWTDILEVCLADHDGEGEQDFVCDLNVVHDMAIWGILTIVDKEYHEKDCNRKKADKAPVAMRVEIAEDAIDFVRFIAL